MVSWLLFKLCFGKSFQDFGERFGSKVNVWYRDVPKAYYCDACCVNLEGLFSSSAMISVIFFAIRSFAS